MMPACCDRCRWKQLAPRGEILECAGGKKTLARVENGRCPGWQVRPQGWVMGRRLLRKRIKEGC